MANIAITVLPETSTLTPPNNVQHTKDAFVDMPAGTVVYDKADGTYDIASGAAADAKARWWGVTTRACKSGQPVTARHGCQFGCVTGLNPGDLLYLGTNGGFDAAPTTGSPAGQPIGRVIDANNIYIFGPTR